MFIWYIFSILLVVDLVGLDVPFGAYFITGFIASLYYTIVYLFD